MKTARFLIVLLSVASCFGAELDIYTKVETAIKQQNKDRVNRLLAHHEGSLTVVELDQLMEKAEDIAFEKKQKCVLLNNWWDMMRVTTGLAVVSFVCSDLETIGKQFWNAYKAFDEKQTESLLFSLASVPIYGFIGWYAARNAYQGWNCQSGAVSYELARSLAKDIKKFKKMRYEYKSPPAPAQ